MIKSKKQNVSYYIIFIYVAILWPILKIAYFHIDVQGRFEMLTALFVILLNYKTFNKSPLPFIFWIIWMIYNTLNSFLKGFALENMSFAVWYPYHILYPFSVLLIMYQAYFSDLKKCIKHTYIALFIYVILGALSMQISSDYVGPGQVSDTEMGNAFFNTVMFLPMFGFLYKTVNTNTSSRILIIASILSFIVIILSGERKAITCLMMVLFGSLYAINMERSRNSFIKLITLFVSAYFIISFIITHSAAGGRFSESMSDSAFQDNLFLQLMGDRGVMYYEGWNLFLNNMITGIGLTNAQWQNDFFVGLLLHTEYMVQLAECGLVGFMFFFLFKISMIRNQLYIFREKQYKPASIIILSTLAALFVMDLVTWSYDNPYNYFVYAVSFAYYNLNLNRNIIQRDV